MKCLADQKLKTRKKNAPSASPPSISLASFVCSSHQPLMHVECLPVVRFQSFLLPLVPTCSLTLPVSFSMFWASAIYSFLLFCPKGSSFSSLCACLVLFCLVLSCVVLRCLVLHAHEHAFEQAQRFKGMLMCVQNKTWQDKTSLLFAFVLLCLKSSFVLFYFCVVSLMLAMIALRAIIANIRETTQKWKWTKGDWTQP